MTQDGLRTGPFGLEEGGPEGRVRCSPAQGMCHRNYEQQHLTMLKFAGATPAQFPRGD